MRTMPKRIISQGAEAQIAIENGVLIKERIKKDYRIQIIDDKLRKQRTRSEAKLLSKVPFAPKVFDVDEKNMKIKMEFIEGLLLKDVFDFYPKNKREKIAKKIGNNVAFLHEKNIIHGDLTTSNMILKKDNIYFVDFGLGFISDRVEDKAVELHLLKQALESRHSSHASESFSNVLEGYKNYNKHKEVLERFKKVEARGRYKAKKALAGI